MLSAYERVRLQQYPHLRELQAQLKTSLMPASFAMGRMARFIARLGTTDKAVLLADMSEQKTSLVLANKKDLMAISFANKVDDELVSKTQFYCSQNLPLGEAGDYLHNKSLFPAL